MHCGTHDPSSNNNARNWIVPKRGSSYYWLRCRHNNRACSVNRLFCYRPSHLFRSVRSHISKRQNCVYHSFVRSFCGKINSLACFCGEMEEVGLSRQPFEDCRWRCQRRFEWVWQYWTVMGINYFYSDPPALTCAADRFEFVDSNLPCGWSAFVKIVSPSSSLSFGLPVYWEISITFGILLSIGWLASKLILYIFGACIVCCLIYWLDWIV